MPDLPRSSYAMPSHIAERFDAADLWTAFLSATAREDPWTPEQLNWFVQGWDGARFYASGWDGALSTEAHDG